jgi:hypothetical protein
MRQRRIGREARPSLFLLLAMSGAAATVSFLQTAPVALQRHAGTGFRLNLHSNLTYPLHQTEENSMDLSIQKKLAIEKGVQREARQRAAFLRMDPLKVLSTIHQNMKGQGQYDAYGFDELVEEYLDRRL